MKCVTAVAIATLTIGEQPEKKGNSPFTQVAYAKAVAQQCSVGFIFVT